MDRELDPEKETKLEVYDGDVIPLLELYEKFNERSHLIGEKLQEALQPLVDIADCLVNIGRDDILKHITFDFNLVRGLNYYTGTVFEATATLDRNNQSVLGGGEV